MMPTPSRADMRFNELKYAKGLEDPRAQGQG